MVPSMELLPPMLNVTVGLSQEMEDLADKPSIEETSSEDTKPKPPKEEEQTAEPLGPIVITDPPPITINITDKAIVTTTIEPAATAGKWPTEAATESSERDDDNET